LKAGRFEGLKVRRREDLKGWKLEGEKAGGFESLRS